MREDLSTDEILTLLDEISTKLTALRAGTLKAAPDEFSPSVRHWMAPVVGPIKVVIGLRRFLSSRGVHTVVALEDDGTGWRCPIDRAFLATPITWTVPGGEWVITHTQSGEMTSIGEIFEDFQVP